MNDWRSGLSLAIAILAFVMALFDFKDKKPHAAAFFGICFLGIIYFFYRESMPQPRQVHHTEVQQPMHPETVAKIEKPTRHPENLRTEPYSVNAPSSIRIGDFTLGMKSCLRFDAQGELNKITDKEVRCDGEIENQSNTKLQMSFSSGRVIDDLGNEYDLSGAAYLLGLPGQMFFGSGNNSQELIPQLPVKFGFVMVRMKREATAANLILKFTTSGNPSSSEVVFREIPIRDE